MDMRDLIKIQFYWKKGIIYSFCDLRQIHIGVELLGASKTKKNLYSE